mgnify:CR=1 FL=1
MKLWIIYRSVGTENQKNRPPFYSKKLALASFLRAVENAGVETGVLFVNDGPIPDDRLAMMSRAGEVIPIRGGSNRASYRWVLRLPRLRRWAPDDLVWFAEDDYLYTADAFAQLTEAVRRLLDVDYFAAYGELRFDRWATRWHPRISEQTRAEGDDQAVPIGRVRWYRAVSTTSTFGARAGTIVADEWLLRNAPFVGGAFDHATCMAYQGFRPFEWRRLTDIPTNPRWPGPLSEPARKVALTVLRGTLNTVALALPERRRRVLCAPDPDLATHMEEGLLAPGTDWEAEAEAVRAWLSSTGTAVS